MLFVLISPLLFAVTTAAPQGCCVPWTHSFTLVEVGGSLSQGATAPVIDDDIIEFNADYQRDREFMVIHRLNQTTNSRGNITILNLYRNNTRYVLTEDGHCLKQQLHAVIQPRCTVNYTYANSFTIGSGTDRIAINSWTIAYPNPNALTTVTITDDGECTPISQTVYGLNADRTSQFVSAMLYANFQKDVDNHAKFVPPAACNNAVSIPVGKRALENATKRKYRFLF